MIEENNLVDQEWYSWGFTLAEEYHLGDAYEALFYGLEDVSPEDCARASLDVLGIL